MVIHAICLLAVMAQCPDQDPSEHTCTPEARWHLPKMAYSLIVIPITALAEYNEILDPSEFKSYFEYQGNFAKDLGMVASWWLTLLDAPPDIDCARFRHIDVLACRQHNAAYMSHLKCRIRRHNDDWIDDALSESHRREMVYNHLAIICIDSKAVIGHRRKALKDLRFLIGDKDYYEGVPPVPCPTQYFQRID